MNFVTGTSRHQTYFATLDDQVAADNPVRLVDAFVDKLQLQNLGFTNTVNKRYSDHIKKQAPCLFKTSIPSLRKLHNNSRQPRFRLTALSFLARWAKRKLSYWLLYLKF